MRMLWTRVVQVGAILIAGGGQLSAQLPAREAVTLVRKIDMTVLALDQGEARIAVSASGNMLLSAALGQKLLYVSADGRRISMIDNHGEKPDQYRTAQWVGWVGQSDSFWIADPGVRRLLVYGADRGLVRSAPLPGTLSGGGIPWVAQPNVPAVLGVLGDGTLLLSALGNRPVALARQIGPARVRTTATGRVLDRPVLPEGWGDPCPRDIAVPGTPVRVSPLFCSAPKHAFSDHTPDGVFVTLPSNPSDSVVVVTRLTLAGDTLFRRTLTVPRLAVTAGDIDSVAQDRRQNPAPGMPSDVVRLMDSVYRATARPYHPLVGGVRVGADETTWLQLPTREKGTLWLVMDRVGAPVLTTLLPPDLQLRAVSRDRVWGVMANDRKSVDGVIYQVGAREEPK